MVVLDSQVYFLLWLACGGVRWLKFIWLVHQGNQGIAEAIWDLSMLILNSVLVSKISTNSIENCY